jgi:hypothetical protein
VIQLAIHLGMGELKRNIGIVNCKFNPRKCDDENMPTINKTKHPKYRREKGT